MNKRSPKPDRTFTVLLSESDFVRVVGQLWKLEHEQTRLASLAEKEGNARHAQPWRQSAAKATQLAERLSRIGGAP